MIPFIQARRDRTVGLVPPLAVELIASQANWTKTTSHNWTVNVGSAGNYDYFLGTCTYLWNGNVVISCTATLDGNAMTSADSVKRGDLRSAAVHIHHLTGASISGSVTLNTAYNTSVNTLIMLLKVNKNFSATPHARGFVATGSGGVYNRNVAIPAGGILLGLAHSSDGATISGPDHIIQNNYGNNASGFGLAASGYHDDGLEETLACSVTHVNASADVHTALFSSFGPAP